MSFSKTKPQGEFQVWLTSAGLALGLLMVVSILGVITVNGLRSFWPRTISEITLPPGTVSPLSGGGTVILAEIHDSRPNPVTGLTELKLNAGNKDAFGQSFLYLKAEGISVAEPKGIIRLERLANSMSIGHPVALRLANREPVSFSSPSFADSLRSALEQAEKRREKLHELESVQIGENSKKITKLGEERRALTVKAAPGNPNPSDIARLDASEKSLRETFATLDSERKSLRALLDLDTLAYKLANGTERTVSIDDVIRFEFPNDTGLLDRFATFCGNLWSFCTEEPRQANTEGGIAPAIFGTATLTLLLSLAVTPFGVIAAIYLREYARQGFLVRCIRIAINNLAGVPSIVFGVFGMGFFVYTLGGSIDQIFFSSAASATFGTGGLIWCALTLALMTLPVVIVATEEAIAAVPRGAKEASLALGASKWQTIQRIVLPASAPGILTGMILAMARGAGEVAPLMLVGVIKIAPSLPVDGEFPFVHLDRKIMHLGFHIYDLGFQSPDSDAAIPMVFATTFFLIVLVVLLNLTAIVIRERLKKRFKTEAV